MGLKPKMTSVFIRKGERHIQGEVAMWQLEARISRNCWQTPDTGRSRKDPPLVLLEGALPHYHLNRRFLASQTVRESVSVFSATQLL